WVDLTTPKGTSAAVHQLLPIVGELRDSVQQALYLQRLADRVRILEQVLASELVRLRLAAKRLIVTEEVSAVEALRRRSPLDEYVFGLLLFYPVQVMAFVDELHE